MDKYTYNYMHNFTEFFLLYYMCSKYDNGEKYLKNNSLHCIVCRYSITFLQNELAV